MIATLTRTPSRLPILNPETRECTYHGRRVVLGPKEFALVQVLIDAHPRPVLIDELAERVYGDETRTVAASGLVIVIRRKMGRDFLCYRYGVGYFFDTDTLTDWGYQINGVWFNEYRLYWEYRDDRVLLPRLLFDLAKLLAKATGEKVTLRKITDHLWPEGNSQPHRGSVEVSRLRHYLPEGLSIESVHGHGNVAYRLVRG